MKPLAAKIQPRPTAGAARVDILVSTGGSGAAAGVSGAAYEAAIVRRPRLTIELFSPALDGRTQLGRGDMVLNLNRIRQVRDPKTYYWLGAPITIYDVTDLNLTNAPVEFSGYVKSASFDIDTEQLTLNFEVSATSLDRPVLFNDFTGGGGILGDTQLRGTPKPAGFGTVQNVEPIWFDNTNNIGMIDGYGNCTAITSLFEGGNDFGAKVADYADYATLLARIADKTVAPGRWATCIASGLVGLGAPPVKPITVDATFGSNRTGAIIQRLLNTHAGIATGSIDASAFNALDSAVNYPVHHWMSSPRTVKDLVEALAAACNATILVTFQGLYSVTRAFGGTNVAYINRQSPTRATRVTKWRMLDPDVPTWRMRARTARPGATLTIDQINYVDTLVDTGAYAAAKVYRQGNLVWRSDGAQFLYINATPAAGNALPVLPATSTAYWSQTLPASTAADLVYADGVTIESRKPAEIGANVTETRTALAIVSQGTLATVNVADFATQVGGTSRPDLYATSSDNIIANAALLSGTVPWIVSNGTRTAGVTGDPLSFYWKQTASGTAMTLQSAVGQLPPGSDLYFSGYTNTTAGFTGTKTITVAITWVDATGALIGSAYSTNITTSSTGWLNFERKITRPVGATGAYFSATAAVSGTSLGIVGGIRLAPTQQAATVGADVNGVNLIDSSVGTSPLGRTAVITLAGTAAGITGQGTLATQNSATWATQVVGTGRPADNATVGADINGINLIDGGSGTPTTPLTRQVVLTSLGTAGGFTGQGALATRGTVLSGVHIRNNADSLLLGDADIITSSGTAAAFLNQGALATRASVGFGSAYVTGFGALAGRGTVLSGSHIRNAGDTLTLGDVDLITTQGTAAAITGQGALATRASVGFGSAYVTGFGALAGRATALLGSHIRNAGDTLTMGDVDLITTQGTSAAFTGQAAWATYSGLVPGNVAGQVQYLSTGGLLPTTGVYHSVAGNPLLSTRWPAEGGANVTETRTAASFTGQGSLATLNSVAYGSGNVSGFGTLAGRGTVLSGTHIRNAADTAFLGDADIITSSGTAAAITGQGALATRASVGFGSAYVTGFGVLAGRATALLGSHVRNAADTLTMGDADLITSQGTASAFTGQSSWATYSGLVPGNVAGQVQNLSTGGLAPTSAIYHNVTGTPLLSTRWPAEAGADATGGHTAAAFTGQGALATRGTVLSGTHIRNAADSAFLGDADIITSSGTAAAITGQGALATKANIAWGTGGYLFRDDGLARVTDALAITSLGTAAAFLNQGALATRGTVDNDTHLGGSLATRLAPYAGDSNYLAAGRVAWTGGYTVQDFKPQEAGANVTETRTASAISSQSSWATYSGLVPSNVAGQVQNLSTGGLAPTSAIYHNVTGTPLLSNRFPAEAGANVTESRTAAAIANQSAFATDVRNPSALFNPAGNVLSNPNFKLGYLGWEADAAWALQVVGYEDRYFYSNTDGTKVVRSQPIPMSYTGLVLQAEMFAGGLSSGNFRCDVQCFSDAAGNTFLGYGSASLSAGAGTGWGKYSTYLATVSGTVSVRVRFFSEGATLNTANGPIAIRRIKLSTGTVETPFSDEVTNSSTLLTTPGGYARIADGRNQPVNRSYGLRSTYVQPSLSDVWDGSVTPNVVALNVSASSFANDFGGTISIGSAVFGNLTPATTYYVYYGMSDPSTASGGYYGISTNLNDALAAGKVYIAYWTTRASSGAAGGGAAPGGTNCVAAEAFVPTSFGIVKADQVQPQSTIEVLDEATMAGWNMEPVTSNQVAVERCVTLETETGIQLTCARSTPITLRDRGSCFAPDCGGQEVPVRDWTGFRWERVHAVMDAGHRRVSHIRCNMKTYAAGDAAGRYIYTHNPIKP